MGQTLLDDSSLGGRLTMDLRDLAVTLFGEREVAHAEIPFEGTFARGAGALLSCAYPALEVSARRVIPRLFREELLRAKTDYAHELCSLLGSLSEETHVRKTLRVYAEREKVRIALRELLPDVPLVETARELSDLADATIALSLQEASSFACARMGSNVLSLLGSRYGKVGWTRAKPGQCA